MHEKCKLYPGLYDVGKSVRCKQRFDWLRVGTFRACSKPEILFAKALYNIEKQINTDKNPQFKMFICVAYVAANWLVRKFRERNEMDCELIGEFEFIEEFDWEIEDIQFSGLSEDDVFGGLDVSDTMDCELVGEFEFIEEFDWEIEDIQFSGLSEDDVFGGLDVSDTTNSEKEEFHFIEEFHWENEDIQFSGLSEDDVFGDLDVSNAEDTVTMLLEAKIDQRIHPRIIGQKGHGVRKKQEDFKVDHRFPRANDNPDIIMVTGEEDDVFDGKDYLLYIEEEFLQDILYNESIQSLTKASSRNPSFTTNKRIGFQVRQCSLGCCP